MWLEVKLAEVETAEDLFELFGLGFEPEMLAVHRVAILKCFGRELKTMNLSDRSLTEPDETELCGAVLRGIYDRFAGSARDGIPYMSSFEGQRRSPRAACRGHCCQGK